MTTSDAPTYKMTNEDETVHSILIETQSRFATAAEYLEGHGISTELAQQVSAILSQPFLTSYQELHNKIQADALPHIEKIVVSYVKEVTAECTVTGLWRVMRPNGGNSLEYTVALKDNVLEHRTPFREFRSDYEDRGLNTLIPLIFHLIPDELSSEIVMSEKIELG